MQMEKLLGEWKNYTIDWNSETNMEGNSHLQGIFNRTIRLLECGIRPVYVFDGKPPTLKSGELAKRGDRKRAAMEKLEAAQEDGNDEEAAKWAKQTVKVTRLHNEESKKLLRLLGVPVVEVIELKHILFY